VNIPTNSYFAFILEKVGHSHTAVIMSLDCGILFRTRILACKLCLEDRCKTLYL